MHDRIGLRGSMTSVLGWAEPAGEMPDWRVWRSHVDRVSPNEDPPFSGSVYSLKNSDLCRSIRGFVGWKP